MSPKSISLLAFSFFLLFGVSAAIPGWGYQPILDLKAPNVQEVAKFAVAEYNKQKQSKLVYQSVVSGEVEAEKTSIYSLVIAARDGNTVAKYEAVVLVVCPEFKDLARFKKLEA